MGERRKLTINLFDTHIGLWQDNANDPSFEREIFGGLVRHLRARGWTVGPDRDVARRYPILARSHRRAHKNELRASIEISGRCVRLEAWSENWARSNQHGHRYEFEKRRRMPYLTGLRYDLEARCAVEWLQTFTDTVVTHRDLRLTAVQKIEAGYASSWHKDPTLGRPACKSDYNRKSADGILIEQGATVWFADRSGRILRGTAFYHINNMWWVVESPSDLRNLCCNEIYCACPGDLRRKRNERRRRTKLEGELTKAIAAMRFDRAALIRDLLFGAHTVFNIWSNKNNAFYSPDRGGYTSDRICAGRYTWDEVTREVSKVPHILTAVTPEGLHLKAHEFASYGEAHAHG